MPSLLGTAPDRECITKVYKNNNSLLEDVHSVVSQYFDKMLCKVYIE